MKLGAEASCPDPDEDCPMKTEREIRREFSERDTSFRGADRSS